MKSQSFDLRIRAKVNAVIAILNDPFKTRGLFLKSPETFRAYFGYQNSFYRDAEVLSHQTS